MQNSSKSATKAPVPESFWSLSACQTATPTTPPRSVGAYPRVGGSCRSSQPVSSCCFCMQAGGDPPGAVSVCLGRKAGGAVSLQGPSSLSQGKGRWPPSRLYENARQSAGDWAPQEKRLRKPAVLCTAALPLLLLLLLLLPLVLLRGMKKSRWGLSSFGWASRRLRFRCIRC